MPSYNQPNINIHSQIKISQNLFNYDAPPITWKGKTSNPHTINYWRDLEGARITSVYEKDTNFQNWPKNRLRKGACLPIYYDGGRRFIVVEKTAPMGFRCRELPLPLREVLDIEEYERKQLRDEKRKLRIPKNIEEKKKQNNNDILKKSKPRRSVKGAKG